VALRHAAEDPADLIAVVDDDPAVLKSIARLLSSHGYQPKPFVSGQSLLQELKANGFCPACIIADLSMPGLTGLELQQKLVGCGGTCPIVFVTGFGDVRSSVQAMRNGAVDFLTKPFETSELLDAVHRALDRAQSTREQRQRLELLRRRLASLTPRERAVFEQVVAGYMNKQIAANLGIAEKTVKVHRARVMRKMSVRSVAQLARIAEQVLSRTD
jgi:RNA polymerase sigma factor (sigma-70 family)